MAISAISGLVGKGIRSAQQAKKLVDDLKKTPAEKLPAKISEVADGFLKNVPGLSKATKSAIKNEIELELSKILKGYVTGKGAAELFRTVLKVIDDHRKVAKMKTSEDWFEDSLKKALKSRKTNKVSLGGMFTYQYDPKYWKILPVWDKYPLIICIGFDKEYIWGLNLHYLQPTERKYFIELIFKNTRNGVINIDWNMVKSHPAGKRMIKQYIIFNLKSNLLKIPEEQYAYAINLPTAEFYTLRKKVSPNVAWGR